MFSIKINDLLRRDVTQDLFLTAEGDGRRSGDTGPVRHVGNSRILRQLWAGTYQAHVAAEDVIKLWQFIELEFPHPSAEGSHSLIATLGESHLCNASLQLHHAAEFVDAEEAAIAAHAFLRKQRIPSGCEPYACSNDRHGNGKKEKQKECGGNIDQPARARHAPPACGRHS